MSLKIGFPALESLDSAGKLLIGMGARLHRSSDGALMIEVQTASGLKGWKRNFKHVACYAIESDRSAPEGWVEAASVGIVEPDFKILPLSDTYRLSWFSNELRTIKERLLTEMRDADYSVFTYGGWLGDPGAIAATVARKNGIKHAVWLDRVESRIIRSTCSNWKTRTKAKLTERNENRAVKKATLSLLHGATVYQHFETTAKNPHLCEDIHYSDRDRINEHELNAKIESCGSEQLKIIYVGRADPMKGGKQWLEVLSQLKGKGIEFEANWYGDGSELSDMKAIARSSGLSEKEIHFAGFVSDRDTIKAAYRNAHLLLFCHLSEESPRNLIESLHSATPLIGYADPFSRSLVEEHGGGTLVNRGEVTELVNIISAVSNNRGSLIDLVQRAARSASHLTHERVFDERCEIVKRELS